MKNLIVLLSLFIPSILFSQTLEITEVDTSNYPLVSAKFIALDAYMNIIKDLTIDESDIIENGISQNIVKITNPTDSNMNQSVVLVVDVSGSMSGTNIDLAKNAIREFINLTPFTFTELAILSFDTDLYVNQDFTRNRNKLLNSLNSLNAGGGTSYDVALFSQKNSALNIVSKRPNTKPVVVFLTDGLCNSNYTKVASIANNMGAKIYSITLNMPMPHDLAEITTQTNATYFENVKTIDEAKRAYLSILFHIYKLYGVVYWNAERSCDEVINFDFKTRGTMSASYFYEINPNQTKGVFFSKKIVAFDSYAPAMNKEVLIGTNSAATITNIKVNDSVNFEVFYDFNLPSLIEPGNTLPLRVYRPKTADQIYTEVEVSTDVCPPKKFYIFQGNIATFVIPGDLKLYTPNGGENYFSGQFTDIKWRNKTNNKFVNIYFSTNNGSSYTWLNQSAGDNYNWLVPGYQSDSCLVKVSLETKPMKILDGRGQHNKILVSDDGVYFAYASRKTLYFISSTSGYFVNSIYFKNRVTDFKFSPANGDAIVNSGNKIYVFNSLTDKKHKIKHKKEKPLEYFYSDDGKSVFVFYKNSNFIYEFDASNGKRRKKINVGSNIKVVSFNAGIASILTSDKRWLIWDLNQKQQIDEYHSNLGFVKTDVNSDGQFVVALDRKNQITYWSHYLVDTFLTVQHISNSKPDFIKFNPQNNTLLCYEKNKKITFYSGQDVVFEYVPPRTIAIKYVDFSPVGDEIIFGVADGYSNSNYLQRYNLYTGIVTSTKNTVTFDKNLKGASFSENGNIGAFNLSSGYEIYLFTNQYNSTNDVSDSVFTIKAYTPSMKDEIWLKDVYVGSESSYLDNEVFFNPNIYPAVVDFIDFFGDNSSKFGLISGIPPLGISPSSYQGVEISFIGASKPGVYSTNMFAICAHDTLEAKVMINVIKRPVDFINAKVDLGTINMKASKNQSHEFFKNATDSILTIDSIVNWGPDYNQIFLTNNLTNYNIQPDEKIPFEFSFFGKNRGATNAVFLIYLHNQPEPLKINVAGNVYAPYKIAVKCNVTNSLDNSPISTTVSYYNSDNQVFIATANTNSNGEFSVNLPNELSYKFVAYGVNKDSAFVDLSDVFVDTVITVNLSVLQIKNGMKYNLQNSNFDVASSNLNSGAKHELDKLVDLMKRYPAINILVDGHTDNEGSVDYNLDLSNIRANSVKNYLISKGVDANRITTKGYGATKPICTNNTDDGKAKNRRIEITINTI